MNRFVTTYEGVRSAMADREAWSALDARQLARLAEFALFVYGRTGESELIDTMPEFYPWFAQGVAVPVRREIFARLSTYAREQEIRRDALYPFLLCEDDPEIVSQAAFDLSLYHEPEAEDVPDGPEHILALILKGGLVNPGAALGGLLALGDPDVCERIAPLRPILAGRELNSTLLQLVTCGGGELHAATVDFYLDWLDELAASGESHAFGHVASGLVILRRNAASGVVIEGRRRFPLGRDGTAYLPGMRTHSIADFARRIAPRIERLEAAEGAQRIMPRVREAWLGEGNVTVS